MLICLYTFMPSKYPGGETAETLTDQNERRWREPFYCTLNVRYENKIHPKWSQRLSSDRWPGSSLLPGDDLSCSDSCLWTFVQFWISHQNMKLTPLSKINCAETYVSNRYIHTNSICLQNGNISWNSRDISGLCIVNCWRNWVMDCFVVEGIIVLIRLLSRIIE